MFGDINRVTLMGNVTKDPDLRYTPSGSAVVSFSIATNRRYQKDNQWLDEVAFHNIVVWNNAEGLAKRIRKGTRIYVEGRVQTRSWDGQDGKKNYKTEIIAEKVILIARYEGSNDDGGASAGSSSQGSSSASSEDEFITDESDSSSATSSKKGSSDDIDPNDLPF